MLAALADGALRRGLRGNAYPRLVPHEGVSGDASATQGGMAVADPDSTGTAQAQHRHSTGTAQASGVLRAARSTHFIAMNEGSMTIRLSLYFIICLTLLAAPAAAQGWTDYRNERFGFTLRYPADVFTPEKASEAGDGQVFIAREGNARLLVGALPNDDAQSPAAYQAYIARKSYGDYQIGYSRLAGSWFVLSGEGNGKTFYEKVMFSCAGRLINSFAMIYPTDQHQVFDRIVEGIEASFRPSKTCERFASAPQARRDADANDDQLPRARRSAMADRIARQRGHDVIVVLRRRGPPYDYQIVRGYASH
jgi:hypothetical protein